MLSALSPPPSINPVALPLWFTAVERVKQLPIPNQWSTALSEFGRLCKDADRQPFVGVQHRNAEIRVFLRNQRRAIVRALDSTDLFKGTQKPKRLLKRDCQVGSDGFHITVSLQVTVEDPTWWSSRLTRFRFGYNFKLMRKSARETELILDPSTRIFVYNDLVRNRSMYHLGYTIHCPIVPDYTGVPPGHESAFVLDKLWKPMENAMRPRKSNLILHL